MLKNGHYKIQSPTGRTNEVLLFGPDGKLIGMVKSLTLSVDCTSADVRGTVEMHTGEVHQLLRVVFSAKGILIDGEPKKEPEGASKQCDLDELLPPAKNHSAG
jgi:hypothetical protein